MTVVGWLAATDGLVGLYLAGHAVLRRPRNAGQVGAVAAALLLIALLLGWLALRPAARPPADPGGSPMQVVTRAARTWPFGHNGPVPSANTHPVRRRGPVTVRSMSSPRMGWSLADAVRLAEQGYQLEHIHRRTGYAPAHVRSQRPDSIDGPGLSTPNSLGR